MLLEVALLSVSHPPLPQVFPADQKVGWWVFLIYTHVNKSLDTWCIQELVVYSATGWVHLLLP